MPSVFLILSGAIPVLATVCAKAILAGLEKPSALLEGVLSVLLYTAIGPMAVASLGLLMAGVYQALSGALLKGLMNLLSSIVLNLAILALFLYGFIAVP